MFRCMWVAILSLALVSASTLATPPATRGESAEIWVEVAEKDMDTRMLNDAARTALALKGVHWKHAQTDHFVVHFEQAIFAHKVARMGEFFYSYIADDMQGVKDRGDGRSHILIFRNPKRWEKIRKSLDNVPEWAFSQVQDNIMLLQQADNTADSGDVLAHEMTHLIMNRFFTGRPSIWLNEGIAEYYEEFGYAAYKGIKKSRRAQFQRLQHPYPLPDLLRATSYPADPSKVQNFYQTAKFMVGCLLLDEDRAKFVPFLEDMLKDTDVVTAFSTHYGLATMDDIEKRFRKFAY